MRGHPRRTPGVRKGPPTRVGPRSTCGSTGLFVKPDGGVDTSLFPLLLILQSLKIRIMTSMRRLEALTTPNGIGFFSYAHRRCG